MSRAEQKAARIQILREQSRKRKQENAEKRQQQLWANVDEGSNLDSDGENENSDSKPEESPKENEEQESDESDDEIMKPVPKDKQFWNKDEDVEPVAKEAYLKVSKHKLRKITKDGPFNGKNRQILDADGKPLSSLDAMKEEQRLGGNEMNLETEEVANEKRLKHKGESFLDRVKRKMEENQKLDDKTNKAKLREKRMKKKRQNKERLGDFAAGALQDQDSDDDAGGVQLASYSQSEQSESDVEKNQKSRKRQKLGARDEEPKPAKSAEQRALELLDQEF